MRDAGAAGIQGENCDVLYRDCEIPVTKKIKRPKKHKRSSSF